MIIKILLTLLLSILSGILGRMGGADNSNTLYRDIGCSVLSIITFCLWFGFRLDYWWIYLISFGLHWGAFSTYYDVIFGYDNLYFAGFMSGMALLPLIIVYNLWSLCIIRSILLAIIWRLLKYLPSYVFYWRHDITEEFLRYFSVVITLLLAMIIKIGG